MGADDMSELPPGFVVDGPSEAPALPAGFAIDGAAPATPKKFGWSDTWPAKLAQSLYSGLTLPGDVASGQVKVPSSGIVPGSVPFGDPSSGGERVADLMGMAMPMSAVNVAVRSGAVPTATALKSAAEAGYTTARELGVDIAPQAVSTLGQRIGAALTEKGVSGELAPKTYSILEKISEVPQDSVVTISNLDTLRKSFGHAARDFANPTEQLAAKSAQRHLDDYLANIPAQDVIQGPASEASKILTEARANYAAAKRSEVVTDAVEVAGRNAQAANSGLNVGNNTRQSLNSILKSDRKSSGFSPEELTQMEKVVSGTVPGNTARVLGNALGGGGGLGAAVTAGIGGFINPYLAAAPIVGTGLRALSNASVSRQARLLDELVRSRSPLAQASEGVSQVLSPAQRAALVRALVEEGETKIQNR
jgi:hypothetical protein